MLTGPALRDAVGAAGMQDRDHRVTAGREVVGAEHDRQPVRRYLDRAAQGGLGPQLLVGAPVQASGR